MDFAQKMPRIGHPWLADFSAFLEQSDMRARVVSLSLAVLVGLSLSDRLAHAAGLG